MSALSGIIFDSNSRVYFSPIHLLDEEKAHEESCTNPLVECELGNLGYIRLGKSIYQCKAVKVGGRMAWNPLKTVDPDAVDAVISPDPSPTQKLAESQEKQA